MNLLSAVLTAENRWMCWWTPVPAHSNITKIVRFVVHRFYLLCLKMRQGKWSLISKGKMNN